MNLSSEITGLIRIGVAAIVGWGLTQVLLGVSWINTTLDAGLEVNLDSDAVTNAVTAVGISLYYAAARYAEKRWPQLRFLGLTGTPTYK